MSTKPEIRFMNRKEIDWAIEQAAREGWNPGLHDAESFYAADNKGFLLISLDNEPIGCISAVMYPGNFGFIGFYIIIPEFRGQGYGIQIWEKAMKKLTGCNIGLDGVYQQQETYKKSGFKLAYSNIRFESFSFKSGDILPETKIDNSLFKEILNYDTQFCPVKREKFLLSWLSLADSSVVVAKEGGKIEGYGMIRQCRRGYKIGPLFAENSHTAELIYMSLCSTVPEKSLIYLDIPEVNKAGLMLAEKYEMKEVFGTARMYTAKFPGFDTNKIFGVTTFELG